MFSWPWLRARVSAQWLRCGLLVSKLCAITVSSTLQGPGEFGVPSSPRAAQQTHQNPTPTARRVAQGASTRLRLDIRMLAYADDAGPEPTSVWRCVPSPLPLYLAQEYGLFLPESPFCLRASQRGQTPCMAPDSVAQDCTVSPAKKLGWQT